MFTNTGAKPIKNLIISITPAANSIVHQGNKWSLLYVPEDATYHYLFFLSTFFYSLRFQFYLIFLAPSPSSLSIKKVYCSTEQCSLFQRVDFQWSRICCKGRFFWCSFYFHCFCVLLVLEALINNNNISLF